MPLATFKGKTAFNPNLIIQRQINNSQNVHGTYLSENKLRHRLESFERSKTN